MQLLHLGDGGLLIALMAMMGIASGPPIMLDHEISSLLWAFAISKAMKQPTIYIFFCFKKPVAFKIWKKPDNLSPSKIEYEENKWWMEIPKFYFKYVLDFNTKVHM